MRSFFSVIIITVLFFVFTACQETAPKPENTNTDTGTNVAAIPRVDTTKQNMAAPADSNSIEDKIIDTLFKVPSIIAQSKYIEAQTKGARRLKLWVSGTPSESGEKYYSINAGEDNGESLVTHFNFHVYPDSLRIMYYDIAEDREMTLKEWEEKEAGNKK